MNLKKTVSVVAGALVSVMLAGGAQASCGMKTVGHMYLSFSRQITTDDSPAEAFKTVKADLQQLASAEKIENFAITSSDMSVSASGYSRGLSLHISVGAQLAPNPDAIDTFFRETQPESFSYSESECGGYGSDDESADTTETQAL